MPAIPQDFKYLRHQFYIDYCLMDTSQKNKSHLKVGIEIYTRARLGKRYTYVYILRLSDANVVARNRGPTCSSDASTTELSLVQIRCQAIFQTIDDSLITKPIGK